MNCDFNFMEAKGFKRVLVNAYYVPDTVLGTLIHVSHEVGIIITFIQMRKLRFWEFKQFAELKS